MARTKEMLISVDDFETRVAVLEGPDLTDLYVTRHLTPPTVGNVYLGRVQNVLPGMEAAFVDIGLERNAFLYIDELVLPPEDLESFPKKIQHLLKPGQEIVVQVVREPKGTKGARITSQATLAGRYLVYAPKADFIGVSRRLPLEERETLRKLGEEVKPRNRGVILRTAAKNETKETLKRELRRLAASWRRIERRAKKMSAPVLIHAELDLYLRITRDLFSADFSRLIIDGAAEHRKLVSYLKRTNPGLVDRVSLHKGKIPLFEERGVESQIRSALKRKIWLKSGGYIFIDQTEALTAIDVNTGKYVGKTSLEETILRTNLEAAREIARQLRLRDIGGLIVIDFIDMENSVNRDDVFQTLNEALGEDKTKSKVVEVSRLGLVEMTRKRTSEGVRDLFGGACPHCKGRGWLLTPETLFLQSRREMQRVCTTEEAEAFVFRVNPSYSHFYLDDNKKNLRKVERSTKKRIHILEDGNAPRNRLDLVKKGSRKEMDKFVKAKLAV